MKILIVGLKKNPQLERLQKEGEKRGHQVDGCLSSELIINADEATFKPSLKDKSFEQYDLIYLWAFSKRRWEWATAALYLHQKLGVKIVNRKIIDPDFHYYLSPAIDYLKQRQNDLPFPKSSIISSLQSVDLISGEYDFPLIVKTTAGRQGKGVFKADSQEELKQLVKELLKDVSSIIIREFIPNDGDIRVFTVGYRAIGAMKRTPVKKGEFRSNISLGGKGEKFDLEKSPEIKKLAEKASKLLRTEIAGVDIILNKVTDKPFILEINPGPQFTGLERYTSTNAALEIIKYFEKVYNRPNDKR